FSFAVFAIVLRMLEVKNEGRVNKKLESFLNLMMMACFPLYFISILWFMPSIWVFIFAGLGGLLQLIAVGFLLKEFFAQKPEIKKRLSLPGGRLLYISFLSLVIKLVLQFFCVFPLLNQFVFGHRPVIIGYLHLVLVGFLSFFLIGTSLEKEVLSFKHKLSKTGLLIFVSGFLIQEFALLIDGIDNVIMVAMPAIPPILFLAALIMLTGIILFALSQRQKPGIKPSVVENEQVFSEMGVAKK
ncbi:MAG TPA: hypothetical protein VFJ43_09520, partial [Bacteroidia bacterium]|nr:hypothetical protein [Bacteroidia bacterium]